MKKCTSGNLALLLFSVTIAFISGNTHSQNIKIDPPSDNCRALELQSTDAVTMATQLACYNHNLDNLTDVLSALINERKKLNKVIGTFEQDGQRIADNSITIEQQQTIQQLQLQRAELRAQLHQFLSEKQPALLDRNTNERLFKNYSEAYIGLSIENAELRKLISEYQLEATSHQLATSELKDSNEQQSSQIDQLGNQITKLEQTTADLSASKNLLTQEFNTAESRTALMKKQLLANAALIVQKQNDIVKLQQAQVDNGRDRDAASQHLTRLIDQHTETVDNLIATKESLYLEVNALTEDRDLIKKQTKQASLNSMATLSTRDKEISILSSNLKALNAAHEDLTASLISAEQQLITTNKSYTAEIASLNNKNSTLNSNNTQLVKTVDDGNTAIENLQAQIQEHTENLALSTQKITDLEVQLETANTTRIELSETKNSAVELNSNLTEQLQTRLSQINSLQGERDRLAAKLNAAKSEIINLSENIETITTESVALTQTIDALRSELKHADTTAAELQSKLTSSEQNSSAANIKVNALTAAVNSLESILSESLNNNQHIEASLKGLKTDLDASQRRLDTKQSRLQKLITEKRALIDAHNTLTNASEKMASDIKQHLIEDGATSVSVTRLRDNSLLLKVESSKLFRTGSSKLSNEGKNLLLSVANAISPLEERQIMIEGHSDNVPLGAKLSAIFEDNLGLSKARALSTANFYTDSADISANRISVSGAGSTKPVASNDTSQGRQQNRRVEIILQPATNGPLASLK